MLQLLNESTIVSKKGIIPAGVTVFETYDFRKGDDVLPPMPMLRVIYQKGAYYLLVLKHLKDGSYTVSEVEPRPPLEWYPIVTHMDLSEAEALEFFYTWACGGG